jgi:protein-S-isoprenylcysteine O-methyltransferase Ste14
VERAWAAAGMADIATVRVSDSSGGWLIAQARLEELDLVKRLPAYREYMEQVPRFVPRLRKKP